MWKRKETTGQKAEYAPVIDSKRDSGWEEIRARLKRIKSGKPDRTWEKDMSQNSLGNND